MAAAPHPPLLEPNKTLALPDVLLLCVLACLPEPHLTAAASLVCGERATCPLEIHRQLGEAVGDDDDAGVPVLANLELGIETIECLATDNGIKIRSLCNSIRLLSVVVSLHSSHPGAAGDGGGRTCGVRNSHLAAYAQLYLAVVYKMECNDRIAARHLMQVFADAPGLACRDLLADLWDHVSLPHMLHLKVWFTKEVDLIAS